MSHNRWVPRAFGWLSRLGRIRTLVIGLAFLAGSALTSASPASASGSIDWQPYNGNQPSWQACSGTHDFYLGANDGWVYVNACVNHSYGYWFQGLYVVSFSSPHRASMIVYDWKDVNGTYTALDQRQCPNTNNAPFTSGVCYSTSTQSGGPATVFAAADVAPGFPVGLFIQLQNGTVTTVYPPTSHGLWLP